MKKAGGLSGRYNKSYEDRDKGGAQGSSAFDWKKSPNAVKFFVPKMGKNKVNIIPYEIKSALHPLVRSNDMAIGDLDYVMDVFIHRYCGPSKSDVICPKKTWAKACPVCEASSQAYNDGDKETGGDLKASRRVLYNVVDVNDPDAGVQVMDLSHFLFEKELIEAAREETGDGAIVDFADPDEGKTISFRGSEGTVGTNKFVEFKGFAFEKRTVPVTDDDLADAISFDTVLKMATAEELTRILYGAEDDEDAAPVPAKASRRAAEDIPEEAPARASRNRAPVDEEPAPAPAKSSRRAPEAVDDDVPARSSRREAKAPATPSCPSGHVFGTDNDQFEECDKCTIWDECARKLGGAR